MKPNGQVAAMASYPTYNPKKLADGISFKEWRSLGHGTPHNPEDDALLNRGIQSLTPPGSTFKVVTAGAAMATGVASPYTTLGCPPQVTYEFQEFNNWTSADLGTMGFPRSLEVSCDTFYYQLGWKLEHASPNGGHSERFQQYMRQTGFGHETGIDLANELDGRVPDEEWCEEIFDATREDKHPSCALGWLPGYTVNMAIGQGDLVVTPLQMAVAYAAIANGGNVVEPRIGLEVRRKFNSGETKIIKKVKPRIRGRLPLDDVELGMIRQGLIDVVASGAGTANQAFAGFPLGAYPVAGKTGTAQIGSLESGLNHAWFLSYAPADDPDYVVAVYLEKSGHGGESAAPVARQIYEGIFRLDKEAREVHLSTDESG